MRSIIDQCSGLTVAEKERLVALLRAAIADELAADPGDPRLCPRCGCPEFVRKGRDRRGRQRWLCRGCARTFSAASAGLLSNSKLPPAVWMEFACCMADGLTLRESARRCSVSLYTSWFMRMRVCEVMSRNLGEMREGSFQVDGLELAESHSGNHSRSWWDPLATRGRRAHRCGQDGRSRHCAPDKVCVLCGVNEHGDCRCEAVCNGGAGQAEVGEFMTLWVPEGSALVTDGHRAYGRWSVGRRRHVALDSRTAEGRAGLSLVNALHSRLRGFLRRFNGVSTRRLQRYLDWFCWNERARSAPGDRRGVLFGQETRGRYIFTRALTHLESKVLGVYLNRMGFLESTSYMSILV